MQYPGFLGPAYQSASYMADNERLINLYPERNASPGAPSPWRFVLRAGFQTAVSVNEAPIRGSFTTNGTDSRSFFVAGFELYELTYTVATDTFTATPRGVVDYDANPVTFSWNGEAGNQLFVTSGGSGYLLDLASNAFSTVLPGTATVGAYLDGWFLALDAATSTLQISDLDDGSVWDPTQIVQRSAAADPWVSMLVIHKELWLFGTQTSEVWADQGTFPFPFGPIQGAFLEQGIAAPFSAGHAGIPLCWLGANEQGNGIVWRADGYNTVQISTPAIEAEIQSYDTISDAQCMSYQLDGHHFYVLTFPDADKTWVYDANTELWHEEAFFNVLTGQYNALRVLSHTEAFGKHLVGDRLIGTLYEMSGSFYTDVGDAPLRWMRQPPRISAGQKRINFTRIQLIVDVGQGLVSGQGSDPQVMLQSSNDGGHVFGNERWVSAGKLGAFNTRVFWTQLGQARNRVDRFVGTDPIKWCLVDAEIEMTVGLN